MTAEVSANPTDDPGFIDWLNTLLRSVLREQSHREVWLIRIDNWFGGRWVQFSGMGIVDYEFPAFMGEYDAALDEFRQDKLTFPPFSPNRVLEQRLFVRQGSEYCEDRSAAPPHPTAKRRSERNLHRRVQDFRRSAFFLWYSSKTLANGRGSVMVYSIEDTHVTTWFASLIRNSHWDVNAVKGTSRDYVERLVATDSTS